MKTTALHTRHCWPHAFNLIDSFLVWRFHSAIMTNIPDRALLHHGLGRSPFKSSGHHDIWRHLNPCLEGGSHNHSAQGQNWCYNRSLGDLVSAPSKRTLAVGLASLTAISAYREYVLLFSSMPLLSSLRPLQSSYCCPELRVLTQQRWKCKSLHIAVGAQRFWIKAIVCNKAKEINKYKHFEAQISLKLLIH